jgi:uncharacterized protein (DUF2252 family)
MKIRQELIDSLVNSDWSREKLAEEILIARFFSRRYQAEAHWLDSLASHYRDNQNDDDYGEVCQDLYKEYQDAIAENKETYREKNCNES